MCNSSFIARSNGMLCNYSNLHLQTFKIIYKCHKLKLQGGPHQIRPLQWVYDLGDKSENLTRMNRFDKFNKANRNFFLQEMLDFSSTL